MGQVPPITGATCSWHIGPACVQMRLSLRCQGVRLGQDWGQGAAAGPAVSLLECPCRLRGSLGSMLAPDCSSQCIHLLEVAVTAQDTATLLLRGRASSWLSAPGPVLATSGMPGVRQRRNSLCASIKETAHGQQLRETGNSFGWPSSLASL